MDGRPSLPALNNELWEYKVDELHEEEAGEVKGWDSCKKGITTLLYLLRLWGIVTFHERYS